MHSKALAYLVHLFTALGVVFGFLALIATVNGNIVEGEKIRATSLVLINDEGYKILGTSGWSGQATEGVYTPKSVADLEYETINYTSSRLSIKTCYIK